MRTYYSESHRLHFPQGELFGGELVTPSVVDFERGIGKGVLPLECFTDAQVRYIQKVVFVVFVSCTYSAVSINVAWAVCKP